MTTKKTASESPTVDVPVFGGGTLQLDSRVFAVEGYDSLVYDTVRWQRMKRRAGTHATLTKGMMRGGNRKPWRQKGTGQARAGSNTSPVWVGGAVSHGPQPRSYLTRLPVRVRSLALSQVLSEKVRRRCLLAVENFGSLPVKTKEARGWLAQAGVKSPKLGEGLIVLLSKEEMRADASRSLRNIDGVVVLSSAGANVFDVINHRRILGSTGAWQELQSRLLAAGRKTKACKECAQAK